MPMPTPTDLHDSREPHRMDTPTTLDTGRVLLTVEDAARQLSIGRTTMYALLKAGHIPSVRVGQLRRIPATALTDYVQQLTNQQATAA